MSAKIAFVKRFRAADDDPIVAEEKSAQRCDLEIIQTYLYCPTVPLSTVSISHLSSALEIGWHSFGQEVRSQCVVPIEKQHVGEQLPCSCSFAKSEPGLGL